MRGAAHLIARVGLVIVSLFAGCEPEAPPPESPASYFSTMRSLILEVFYEPQAEPFVGQVLTEPPLLPTPYEGIAFWELGRTNLAALFADRDEAVTVRAPDTLEEMTLLPPQGRDTWDTAAIEALATRVRRHVPTATDASLVVLFLAGVYERDGEARGDVLGVNVAGTPFVAIFKEVVLSTVFRGDMDDGTCAPPSCQRYSLAEVLAEQLVVVHEAAHALGLVDNGVPLASDHRDRERGRHCANPLCVMYFQNQDFKETAASLIELTLATGRLDWFGPECLEDARLFRP